MYYVYILKSANFNRFYIGQTQNVEERVRRHNSRMEKSTAPYVPWILIGSLEKETRTEAIVLETKLKNLNQKRLILFLEKYLGFTGRDEA